MKKDYTERLCLSITGITEKDWRDKLNEINNLGIDTVALILESYLMKQRKLIYEALENSCVQRIPLVHLKNDMEKDELGYLRDQFQSEYLTIHEDSFEGLDKWQGFYKNLFLELNYDNFIEQNVKVKKIGGFCVDLAHFKAAEENWTKEFEYTIERRNKKNLFVCNHLSGYLDTEKTDLHTPRSIKDFAYLKTLPDFVFGRVIAIEIDNSISEQLELKEQIIKLLNSRRA